MTAGQVEAQIFAIVKSANDLSMRLLESIYRADTRDRSRSRPRMAVLSLLEQGLLSWDEGGIIRLTKAGRELRR